MGKGLRLVLILILTLMLTSCASQAQVVSNEIANTNENPVVGYEGTKSVEKDDLDSNKEIEGKGEAEIMDEKMKNLDKKPNVKEVIHPVVKKTIVLDPGHSKGGNKQMEKNSPNSQVLKVKDPGGAAGVSTRLPEYEINMRIAKKLKVLLEKEGFNVIMTKNSNEENPGNVERAEIGNRNNANLVVRIHCDSSDSSSTQGASMLVPEPVGHAEKIYEVSQKYGKIILENYISSTGAKNRGISKRKDLTGFNWSKVPVVLIEMGFMSNPTEDQMLASEAYENKMATGLLNGIKQALK
jgi:N-acetylmuramoyl-L-alanine amidase